MHNKVPGTTLHKRPTLCEKHNTDRRRFYNACVVLGVDIDEKT